MSGSTKSSSANTHERGVLNDAIKKLLEQKADLQAKLDDSPKRAGPPPSKFVAIPNPRPVPMPPLQQYYPNGQPYGPNYAAAQAQTAAGDRVKGVVLGTVIIVGELIGAGIGVYFVNWLTRRVTDPDQASRVSSWSSISWVLVTVFVGAVVFAAAHRNRRLIVGSLLLAAVLLDLFRHIVTAMVHGSSVFPDAVGRNWTTISALLIFVLYSLLLAAWIAGRRQHVALAALGLVLGAVEAGYSTYLWLDVYQSLFGELYDENLVLYSVKNIIVELPMALIAVAIAWLAVAIDRSQVRRIRGGR